MWLCSCGSESESVNDSYHENAFVYADSVAFGKVVCDSSLEGRLVFVREESKIYYCARDSWHSLSGADGKDGADGVDGADGRFGSRGKNGLDGTECSIYSFVEGFVLVCGETSAEIRLNMAVPDSCSVKPDGLGAYRLTCGDQSFTVNRGVPGDSGVGCEQSNLGNGYVRLVCGLDTLITAKAFCGGEAYDPEGGQFCYEGSLVDRCDGRVYDIVTQDCIEGNVINLAPKE